MFTSVTAPSPLPPQISDARVISDNGIFVKRQLYKMPVRGVGETISKIFLSKDKREREQIIREAIGGPWSGFSDVRSFDDKIVALHGQVSYEFDIDGEFLRSVPLKIPNVKVKVGGYELDGNNTPVTNIEIVRLSGKSYGFSSMSSVDGARVFDSDGNMIWNYGEIEVDLSMLRESDEAGQKRRKEEKGIRGLVVGDITGDGVSEFIVRQKNVGLVAFKKDGEKLWVFKDARVYGKLTVSDVDNDGKNEVIELGQSVVSGSGTLLRKPKQGPYSFVYDFVEGDRRHRSGACEIVESRVTCEDLDGNYLLTAKAPLSKVKKIKKETIKLSDGTVLEYHDEQIFDEDLVAFKDDSSGKNFVALIGSFPESDRSVFYIFDTGQKLVYHELIPEAANSVDVLKRNGKVIGFVVAGEKTLWSFELKN